jgi:putative hydrolase of the HAD superfamily
MIEETVLVFDLDDTLYLERDFAFSGFHAVGEWVQATMGIEAFSRQCEVLFDTGRRGRIFDEALEMLGIARDEKLVAELVDLYRNHPPTITLAPDAQRYLSKDDNKSRRAIITDGPAATQMGKIRALGLDRLVDHLICTDVWGRPFWKPHERAFEAVETWSGAAGAQLVYVADNPTKDFIAPRRRGWRTVQIVRPGRVHLVEAAEPSHGAHAVIESFDQLDACLVSLASVTSSG